ncbi:hypothetical protein SLS62_009409 [Diatrype stigma]|uniref:Uncharacterized protein n=1 Tax=Diatrype stigma TaxID=117547 RepID=A0AAN9UES5_9PEZI
MVNRFIRRIGLGEEPSSSIGDSIRRFESHLQYLKASLTPPDDYSAAGLAACRWQAQYIMVHMSWHQCHCDLYRIFMEGYSEAAPPLALAHTHPRERARMQQRCLEHAEGIVRVLTDFVNYGRPDDHRHLERDAAVCAFESARIILFRSRTALPDESSLSSPSRKPDAEAAIAKARTCLHIITKYFPSSAPIQPMRKELERLISNYSVRLALQMKEAMPPTDPDPPPPPRVSSGVSQFANSRQRLSIQSLLLQSDFVDDSQDIAAPAPVPPVPTAPSSSSLSPHPYEGHIHSNNDHGSSSNNNGSRPPHHPQQQQGIESGMALGMKAIGTGGIGSRGGGGGGMGALAPRPQAVTTEAWTSSINPSPSSSQNHPYHHRMYVNAAASTTAAPHDPAVSAGAGAGGSPLNESEQLNQQQQQQQQQRGLTFNPWMGFPGTEDLLSGGMNDDY